MSWLNILKQPIFQKQRVVGFTLNIRNSCNLVYANDVYYHHYFILLNIFTKLICSVLKWLAGISLVSWRPNWKGSRMCGDQDENVVQHFRTATQHNTKQNSIGWLIILTSIAGKEKKKENNLCLFLIAYFPLLFIGTRKYLNNSTHNVCKLQLPGNKFKVT